MYIFAHFVFHGTFASVFLYHFPVHDIRKGLSLFGTEQFLWIPSLLWYNKGWHSDSHEPNCTLWLSPLFTPFAKLGLLLCLKACGCRVPMVIRMKPWRGGSIWTEHKAFLIWMWMQREGSFEHCLCVFQEPIICQCKAIFFPFVNFITLTAALFLWNNSWQSSEQPKVSCDK